MQYTIEPFQRHHLLELPYNEVWYTLRDASKEYVKYPCFTGRANGQFVGAAGFVIPFEGVGEGWAVTSSLVYKHRTFFHRSVKRIMREVSLAYRLLRLQACVRMDFPIGHRWIKKLGFEHEATLRKYGRDGQDVAIYVIFPQERWHDGA